MRALTQITSIISLMIFSIKFATAEVIDYSDILFSGTGSAGGNHLVRYLAWSKDDCIIVQNLIPGGKGTISAAKDICSLDGQSFRRGFADVSFKSGNFRGNKLTLTLGFSPLRGSEEAVMDCEVVFYKGVANRLSCKKAGNAEGNCKQVD